MSKTPYSIFSVLGIEIEYMLVDKNTLNVQPISDQLLAAFSEGKLVNEVKLGDIVISNELVLHVLELKNDSPRALHEPVAEHFQQTIRKLQPLLEQHHLRLLPTGAHPWMDPGTETKTWPHGNNDIYKMYHKIFNCKGHGWANLQSMHVNLPFSNDEEFGALHNTIRLILPIIPALAASTPFLDGKTTGLFDSRLSFYEKNQQKIPSISGQVIPEYIKTQDEYQRNILEPMYRDIAPHDPEGLLQEEWLNSRAAIPKFEYGALEIRIIDSQECVNADIAIAHVIHAILKNWCNLGHYPTPPNIETKVLKAIFNDTIRTGLNTPIEDMKLLQAYLLPKRRMNIRDIWSLLIEGVSHMLTKDDQLSLEHTLRNGNLSERILSACKKNLTRSTLHRVYRELSDCLLTNQYFKPSL
jgi:gamma-glutamyl:cysteine ligase YbdK (ATP-grasp superfamily)